MVLGCREVFFLYFLLVERILIIYRDMELILKKVLKLIEVFSKGSSEVILLRYL